MYVHNITDENLNAGDMAENKNDNFICMKEAL